MSDDRLMHPVRLTGERVVLREFREDDGQAAYEIDADARVAHWLSFDTKSPDQSRQALAGVLARAQLEPRKEYYLAVALPESDRLIGFVRIGLAGVKAGKLGYAIRADEWGKGYATDAARTNDHVRIRAARPASGQCSDRPRQRRVDCCCESPRLSVRGSSPRSRIQQWGLAG
jgi:[ribosomal protein S5]-alanine N-acetyltransferase